MHTIKDVARAAGVSVATVSRVFNDTARVTADTRDRVVEAAGRLGYSAHGAARTRGGTSASLTRRFRPPGAISRRAHDTPRSAATVTCSTESGTRGLYHFARGARTDYRDPAAGLSCRISLRTNGSAASARAIV